MDHIKVRHPEDAELFAQYANAIISDPDLVIKDSSHSETVFLVKKTDSSNLNVVIRLSLGAQPEGFCNSVMTFYRIRDKNLAKLQKKDANITLYKKE
ncbi:MAG: hypothetical protein E7463_08450 [Ruminococcaceae bacterium]|nr:hypothetical protein [Oscillospiraceae bacterium]